MTGVTPYTLAHRFMGVREAPGTKDNLLIQFMLTMAPMDDGDIALVLQRIASPVPSHDSVPWCAAFCSFIAWLGNWPRSRSLAARSWLQVGAVTPLELAVLGDIVILSRGESHAGPEVINAPGHVGIYAGMDQSGVALIGGNQGDRVSLATFPLNRLLGVRRIVSED